MNNPYQELPHGYTLKEVDQLVGVVFAVDYRRRWYAGIDVDEKAAIVRLAILETLYEAPERPTRAALLAAAWYALNVYIRGEYQYHGRDRSNAWLEDPRPRWILYWSWLMHPTGSPEQTVIERRALHQIWPQLSKVHREALFALAAHDDYEAAADAVNKRYGTFLMHISNARREFRRLWHEHETPRGTWRHDRRVRRR